jgi:hypothetical protein
MSKKTPAVPPAGLLIVEWGSRSKALQARLTSPRKISGDNFLLIQAGGNPVKLGWLNASDKATWQTAAAVPQSVTRNKNDLSVSAQLSPPSGASLLRLEFDLRASAGGSSSLVLSLKQLFTASATGLSTADQCAITVMPLVTSANGPKQGSLTARTFPGLHPLLTMSSTRVSINCEFVDVTELWWSVRKDLIGWYLNPLLGGRQTNLRVLGWTGGGPPMIWFAVIPDAAAATLTPVLTDPPSTIAPADLVFYRPVPGVNSFAYAATEQGFMDAHHDDTTCRMLARYLLSPIPAKNFPTIKSGGKVKEVDLLADQLQPLSLSPTGSPLPLDPMQIASGYPHSFRPVGLEGAFNRVGGNRVLFLPLGSGDLNDTYEGAALSGLRTTVRSAITLLWSLGAVDSTGTSIPDFSQRELWLAGHSAGNLTMWGSAQRNKADVARIITFDASPWGSNLAGGISTIRAVKAAHGTLAVFAIVTPNLSQSKNPPPPDPWQGLDDDTLKKLMATGATITVLPALSQRVSFWKPVPASPTKTFVQYFLANWSVSLPPLPPDKLLIDSAKTPAKWRFLFFHEMAVFGGDLILPPPSPPGVPASSPSVRTFFEQALAP